MSNGGASTQVSTGNAYTASQSATVDPIALVANALSPAPRAEFFLAMASQIVLKSVEKSAADAREQAPQKAREEEQRKTDTDQKAREASTKATQEASDRLKNIVDAMREQRSPKAVAIAVDAQVDQVAANSVKGMDIGSQRILAGVKDELFLKAQTLKANVEADTDRAKNPTAEKEDARGAQASSKDKSLRAKSGDTEANKEDPRVALKDAAVIDPRKDLQNGKDPLPGFKSATPITAENPEQPPGMTLSALQQRLKELGLPADVAKATKRPNAEAVSEKSSDSSDALVGKRIAMPGARQRGGRMAA